MTYNEPRRIRVVDELRYCHRDRYWMDCEGHMWRWDWYEEGYWSYRDDEGWASRSPGTRRIRSTARSSRSFNLKA